ncbi:host nuclease inhibitor protein [Desulfovibrio sulfodismutans]|uniref:Host nuclease inhibitor protein n=1 Tax=Desulfolutivibrio sulfodismutans TaxID=63561 RepID=A0A7K3NKM1_9BACT|nr:host nuclease inhibitor protein [Desulfolutivibrio sulfodismutans]NDY56305.1 host nuclease inhibitor protein [Desulfolutivibrio sulfodismutans]QLA11490.1 host nuclease inhibitor protein [Desulfolutivibrio sulfodismutans DSM 3696]QLA13568.1 host nuclease inhibitor protein [Desulfolutivibrio sulfodismutans DSM 3696]QLA14210.1 host nuclease inhibitor protein [Desulfolutivibrio sulfodismutans DSM 3696]
MAVAYCFTNGVVRINETCPDGALPIASGDACQLQRAVRDLAVHAWDGVIMLVPNLALAQDDSAKVAAVLDFSRRVEQSLRREQ